MKRFLIACAVAVLALPAYAAEPGKQVLLDAAVSSDDRKHAVTLMIDWPAGASVPDHTHPGDEYAVVQEGEIEITVKGAAPYRYKAGEAYHNAKDVVHSARAVGDKPAKTIATLIVEKDKPLSQKVE